MNDQEQRAIDPRNVIIYDIQGIERSDYPDMSNSFVVEAYNTELDRELTELELDHFNDECSDVVQEHARLIAVGG